MFLPIQAIIQNEPMIDTQEDIILMLDRIVLPMYQNHITPNPAYTKAQCFGIVESFLKAGRLHLRFKPVEIDKAVDAFLEDRLWVDKEIIAQIRLAPHHSPYSWMAKPSLLRMVWQMVRQFGFLGRNLFYLAKTGITYRWYSFYAERTFTIPKAPSAPKIAEVKTLAKKDS